MTKLSVYQPNPHYFQDANGTPVYLVGYYQFWFGRTQYDSINNLIIDRLSENKVNYVRIIPHEMFYFDGSKWDLTKYDSTKINSYKTFISYAESKKVNVNISIFHGAGLKSNRWANQVWNIDNNVNGNLIGDLDRDNDGDATGLNEFYDYDALTGSTSDTYRLNTADVQRAYVNKIITEFGGYSNTFYEIGNEVTGSYNWIKYWVDYITLRTDGLITVDDDFAVGFNPLTEPNTDGATYHHAGVSGNSLTGVYGLSAYSYNRWLGADTDGNTGAYSDSNINRKGAWIALTTGGHWLNYDESFATDGTINTTKALYFRYLQDFISTYSVPFWDMYPSNSLISKGNTISNTTTENYLIYVADGGSVTVQLLSTPQKKMIIFNPRTGLEYSNIVISTDNPTITLPDTNDWVIYIKPTTTICPVPICDFNITVI